MRAHSIEQRPLFVHVRGGFIHTVFKSLASVCELHRGDAAYSIEPVGAGVIPMTQGDTHAGYENSRACGRWRIARAHRSGRARKRAIAQQSRRRHAGSGRYQTGDNGSALATPPPSSPLPSSSSFAPLASSPPSPSSSPSMAPVVRAAASRRYRAGPFHRGPAFGSIADIKLAGLLSLISIIWRRSPS
jgi:hypothetical protein